MAVARSVPQFVPDERQREAIAHVHGPMLVVAGAGTGKTTVLTQRIARLIADGHARADEILAVTYTENAAREMRERVEAEFHGIDIAGLRATTFHAYCNDLLACCGKQFGVLDEKDLWIYLRKRIRELRLNYFVRAANVSQFLDDLLDFMRRCQDELVGPEKYADYVRRLEHRELPIPRVARSRDADTLTDEEVLGRCHEIARVFATVERMLQEENLGSFGHMITRAYELLARDSELLARERARARFMLVDEFQDANFAQVKILRELAGEECNVFAVGDPDQAIFRFRGASSAAFGLFQRHFPGARLVTLDKNRRSTEPILRCAFRLIKDNPPVFVANEKSGSPYRREPLKSAREEEAANEGRALASVPVEAVVQSDTDRDVESADAVGIIRQRQRQLRCAWKDFAILYRQHLHRDQIAEELAQQGIPFSIENMDVMDTPEARDLLACLGAVVSPLDSAGLFRAAALPQFSVAPEKLRAAMASAGRNAKEANLASVLQQIEGGSAVLNALQQTREEIAKTGAKSRAALDIIIRRFAFDRGSRALNAVLEFVKKWEEKPKAITKTGEIAELLEYLEYFREARGAIPLPSPDENAVNLMTAHAAKGLEFKHVFILRANSNSFPASYREPLVEFPRELRDPDSVAQDEGKVLHEQEERRLFYVSMTRARDSLTMYARRGRGRDVSPPGFLRDLLKDSSLGRWLSQRGARGLQTDLFGEAAPLPSQASRTGQWLSMPPAFDLSARLSATAVGTYETCPLQFKLEREWRIPREAPAAMQYGAVIHRVLRSYYDSVRLKRPIGDAEIIELFCADLASCAIPDRYQHELYEKQGIAQLQDFLAATRQVPPPKVLHTEEHFEVRIGEATVVGRIDRMDDLGDGRVAIVDYKTGKPQSQEDADESLQLSIYTIAAQQKWGYRVERLAFYNLEENSSVTTARSQLDLQEAKNRVEDVALEITAGRFDAKTGYHCRFCPYRNVCPATERRMYNPAAGKAAHRTP